MLNDTTIAVSETMPYINITMPDLYEFEDGNVTLEAVDGAVLVRPATWYLKRRSTMTDNDPALINATYVYRSEEFSYFVPYHNGDEFSGLLTRIRTASFDAAVPDVETLDLTLFDPTLKGFASGFQCM